MAKRKTELEIILGKGQPIEDKRKALAHHIGETVRLEWIDDDGQVSAVHGMLGRVSLHSHHNPVAIVYDRSTYSGTQTEIPLGRVQDVWVEVVAEIEALGEVAHQTVFDRCTRPFETHATSVKPLLVDAATLGLRAGMQGSMISMVVAALGAAEEVYSAESYERALAELIQEIARRLGWGEWPD